MGQGQVKPVEAKVEAISDFPVPSGKRQLMHYLVMAGYYRKFYNNSLSLQNLRQTYLAKGPSFIIISDDQAPQMNIFNVIVCILKHMLMFSLP